MNERASGHEVLVGLVVVIAIGGVLSLLVLAGGGPGFLSAKRTIDVYFRDGQGLRAGSPVRIAGIDAGRVVDVDLIEYEGTLRARARVALPTHLALKLKQDVTITIQPALTGQSRLNIVSSGRSSVALVPGQVVQGLESTFFDPILEQVGLGPVERNHISHSIAEMRKTVDATSPRVREIVNSFQTTATGVREAADSIRPTLEATASQAEQLTRRLNAAAPTIEATLTRIESVSAQTDSLLTENRANLRATLASIRDLTATLQDISLKNRGRFEQLLINVDGTRARADRALYNVDLLVGQGVQMVSTNRTDIERTVTNVRDATDWADKLVQKLYANPFFLSPFYKPTPEDTRVQVSYDTAQVFTKGAQELNDAIKRLDTMQTRAASPAEQQQLDQLRRGVYAATEKLAETSQLLAESLRKPGNPNVRRR